MKTCNKCKIEKSFDMFYKSKKGKNGLTEKCKDCHKKYCEINREKIKEYQKEYSKKYYELNKIKLINKQKEYIKNNKENRKKYHKEYMFNRRKLDKLFNFNHNIRNIISKSFKRNINNFDKTKNTESILGCTIEEFRIYIQSKFKEGMSIENHGEWHLDHIKPLKLATTEEEIIKLNHYTNFQPLWAIDNLRKGSIY